MGKGKEFGHRPIARHTPMERVRQVARRYFGPSPASQGAGEPKDDPRFAKLLEDFRRVTIERDGLLDALNEASAELTLCNIVAKVCVGDIWTLVREGTGEPGGDYTVVELHRDPEIARDTWVMHKVGTGRVAYMKHRHRMEGFWIRRSNQARIDRLEAARQTQETNANLYRKQLKETQDRLNSAWIAKDEAEKRKAAAVEDRKRDHEVLTERAKDAERLARKAEATAKVWRHRLKQAEAKVLPHLSLSSSFILGVDPMWTPAEVTAMPYEVHITRIVRREHGDVTTRMRYILAAAPGVDVDLCEMLTAKLEEIFEACGIALENFKADGEGGLGELVRDAVQVSKETVAVKGDPLDELCDALVNVGGHDMPRPVNIGAAIERVKELKRSVTAAIDQRDRANKERDEATKLAEGTAEEVAKQVRDKCNLQRRWERHLSRTIESIRSRAAHCLPPDAYDKVDGILGLKQVVNPIEPDGISEDPFGIKDLGLSPTTEAALMDVANTIIGAHKDVPKPDARAQVKPGNDDPIGDTDRPPNDPSPPVHPGDPLSTEEVRDRVSVLEAYQGTPDDQLDAPKPNPVLQSIALASVMMDNPIGIGTPQAPPGTDNRCTRTTELWHRSDNPTPLQEGTPFDEDLHEPRPGETSSNNLSPYEIALARAYEHTSGWRVDDDGFAFVSSNWLANRRLGPTQGTLEQRKAEERSFNIEGHCGHTLGCDPDKDDPDA